MRHWFMWKTLKNKYLRMGKVYNIDFYHKALTYVKEMHKFADFAGDILIIPSIGKTVLF